MGRRGAVTARAANAGLHVRRAVWQSCQICRRNRYAPASIGGDACSVGFTAKSDGDGLPAFNPAGAAGKGQASAFFGGVNYVIAGNGVDADCHRR